jgi:hypothetical protein
MKRLRPVQDQYAHVCVRVCVCTSGTRMCLYSATHIGSGNNGGIHIRISFMMSGTVIVFR